MFDFTKLFTKKISLTKSKREDQKFTSHQRHSPLNPHFTNPYFDRALLDTKKMKNIKRREKISVDSYRNFFATQSSDHSSVSGETSAKEEEGSSPLLEATKEVLASLRVEGVERGSETKLCELWLVRDRIVSGSQSGDFGSRPLRDMPVALKTKLLMVYCPHDQPMGRTLAAHFAMVFPFVHVYESVDFMFGVNTYDFWERVVETTPYIFVLMSKAFLEFALDDLGLKLAFRDIELMDLENNSVLLPIYLEDIPPEEFGSLFDATNRLGVQMYGPHLDRGLRCLHRSLRDNLERDIQQKYDEVHSEASET